MNLNNYFLFNWLNAVLSYTEENTAAKQFVQTTHDLHLLTAVVFLCYGYFLCFVYIFILSSFVVSSCAVDWHISKLTYW